MKYFKNTELAKIYKVSEKSVRNWIDGAEAGKLDLQLYEEKGKRYVANSSKNTLLIEKLVEKGKKYKNSRGIKTIAPANKFYETYSPKQIFDIISSLTIHHEIPLKYSYVDGGADYWDQYAQRLFTEDAPNMLTSTINLLDFNLEDIDRLLGTRKQINVVDLGPGNCLPVKKLLEHLLSTGRLKRYIALDISKEMLAIAEQNLKQWFGDRIKYESYVRDIEYERFDDLFAQDYEGNDDDIPVNLVLLLGGTLSNLRSPNTSLQAIHDSMNMGDLMIYSTKLDTPTSRRYFDFNISPEVQSLTPRHKLTLDLLGIDSSLYEVEQWFDEQKLARFISIKPKIALSINLELAHGTRHIELNKEEPLLLWRYWHQDAINIINQVDQGGFNLLHATKSRDQEYLLLISNIKIND